MKKLALTVEMAISLSAAFALSNSNAPVANTSNNDSVATPDTIAKKEIVAMIDSTCPDTTQQASDIFFGAFDSINPDTTVVTKDCFYFALDSIAPDTTASPSKSTIFMIA